VSYIHIVFAIATYVYTNSILIVFIKFLKSPDNLNIVQDLF